MASSNNNNSNVIVERIHLRSSLGIANAINFGRIKKAIVIAGAGISTGSGIPDFRSENGLYAQLEKKGFNPSTVFTKNWFENNREEFYNITGGFMEDKEPCEAHKFLKWMYDKGILSHIFTQNIDGLERKAGIPESKITAVHGEAGKQWCPECGWKVGLEDQLSTITSCPECGTLTRPDVVLFGESIKLKPGDMKLFKECDTLFIMGTSLTVYPLWNSLGRIITILYQEYHP